MQARPRTIVSARSADGPYDVEVLDPVWIPVGDNCRLAARIWLPAEAERRPAPAILEYIPYRRSDNKAVRDHQIHAHFAAHGYASIRVDMRGSGDSDGVLEDEYLPQEMDDGLKILRWLEEQPWCNGRIGLFGLSWGGFNALQLASLQPPQVGAVVTVCSSDDRYADDVHYMGGCLLTDNLSWASNMFAFNTCPPDPAVVGERWRDMWLERLEKSNLWVVNWLRHQHRDAYWKSGSINENYGAIKVPVLAASGWRDGYTNPVFRLMQHLAVPRRAIVGAWGHKYPHMGGPGPAIDFLGECRDWWDRWLRGVPNGVEEEPRIRAWMMEPASPLVANSPGRWVAEAEWPSPRVEEHAWRLSRAGLEPFEDEPACQDDLGTRTIESPLSVGLFAGKWCSYAEETDLPWDQRQEDGGALLFDTAPLEEDLEILGAPRVRLRLAADRPVAMVAVRLCAVAPDDRSARVSFGVLNLTHRDSHETPQALTPGAFVDVSFDLNYIAQRFPAGYRIRLAVSSSYWPLAWPSPRPARLTIDVAHSSLTLPVRPTDPNDAELRSLGTPRMAEAPSTTLLTPADRRWTVNIDLASNRVEQRILNNDARVRLVENGLEVRREALETYTYANNDYGTVCGTVEQLRQFQRGDWSVRTVTRTILSSTETEFLIRATLDAYHGDVRIYARSWDEAIPRVLV